MATYTCTVINVSTNLNGRSGPSISSSIVAKKQNGNIFTADQRKEDSSGYIWYREASTGRWFCHKEPNGNTLLKVSSNPDTPVVDAPVNNNDTVVQNPVSTSTETYSDNTTLSGIQQMVSNRNTVIAEAVDGSVRLFGLPHQFTPYTDHRLSTTTNLGRVFTETFIFDAPSVFIKPGTSNFLPGMTESDKKGLFQAIFDLETRDENATSLKTKLIEMTGSTANVKYFEFVPKYTDYMSKVNMLCRICAVFMGIHKEKVPWVNSSVVTFGNYDWRYYKFKSTYSNESFSFTADDVARSSGLDAFRETINDISKDDSYIQFYVDAGMSFGESASNSTTRSMLSSFTDQLSSIGKELAFVSGAGAGINGTQLDEAIKAGGDAATQWIDENFGGSESSVGGMFKRIFSTSNQLIAGGNFIVPDIWDSSEYGKSYSFSINLSSPYGNKMSQYINILVPLMHILAMALPTQVGANAYTSPNLIKAYAPGWFSCDLGIIDSISIEKGGNGDAWSSSGLPNEIKVSLGIRDLYSNLALPEKYSITDFFTNDNLINYLMVNCGIDITDQNFSTTVDVLTNLFAGSIENKITNPIHNVYTGMKEWIRGLYGLYH